MSAERPKDRRRSMARPAGVLLSVLLVWRGGLMLAASVYDGRGQAVGALLLCAAAVLFGASTRREEAGLPPLELTAAPPPTRVRTGTVPVLLTSTAVLLSAFGIWRFLAAGETPIVRLAWLASIAVLLVAQWGSRAARGDLAASGQRSVHVALLLGILALSGAALLHRLGTLPFNLDGDFASFGLQARTVAEGGEPNLFAYGWAFIPIIGYLPCALTMSVAGHGIYGLYLAGVLEGLATLALTYVLGRDLYGPRVGVLATALVSISYTFFHFARTCAYIDPVPYTVLAILLLVRALRHGSGLAAVASGIVMALDVQMYYAGRIVALLAPAVVLLVALRGRAWLLARWREVVLVGLGGVVALGPMVPLFLHTHDAFVARSRDVLIFRPECMAHLKGVYHVTTDAAVVREQLRRSALVFHTYFDTGTQFGARRPFLDPFSAAAMTLGIGAALALRRRLGSLLPLVWIVLMLLVGCALTINAPFFPRVVGLVVPTSLLGGLALERLYTPVRDFLAKRNAILGPLLPGAVITGLLAATALSSWRWYSAEYGSWATGTARLARYLAAHPAFRARSVAVPDWWANNRDIQFLAPGSLIDDVDEAAVVKGDVDTSLPLVISPRKALALDALHRRFPNGVFETFPANYAGETAFIVFRAR